MINFIFLGIIASIFQLVILREFTFSIAKNEFSLIVALAFWLSLCSLGGLVGRKKQISKTCLSVLLSLAFSILITAVHLLKSFFGLAYYELTSLGFVFLSSLVLIGPLAFSIGYCFSIISCHYLENRNTDTKDFARFFAFEAIGFFIGGLSFTLLFSNYTNPFIFSLLPIFFLLKDRAGFIKKSVSLVIIALIVIAFSFSFSHILKKEFLNAKILNSYGSKYGPIILTEKSNVKSFYINGSLAATSEDSAWNEEFIHISIASNISVKKVLLICPSIYGQIQELLKYKTITIDCIDINAAVIEIIKKNLSKEKFKKINFIIADPRLYLKKTTKQYDCILMNIPPPQNLLLNRYFTKEFFLEIKKHLLNNGVFSFYIPSKRDILSPQILKFNSCILNTLDGVFAERIIVPSDSMIVIASKKRPISQEKIIHNFENAKIKTGFLTVYHLKDYLNQENINYINKMLDKKIEQNLDLAPFGFLYYMLIEQIKFYPRISFNIQSIKKYGLFIILFSALIIAGLSLLKRKAYPLISMGSIGFTSLSFNTLILVLFQIYSGALFWKLGIFIAIFMVGLSVGAFLVNQMINSIKIKNGYFLLYGLWIILLSILWLILNKFSQVYYLDLIFYFYSLMIGFLTGSTYPIIINDLSKNNLDTKNIPIFTYSADLIGAFLGAIITSILLVPFFGVVSTIVILICLNLIFLIRN